MLDGHGPEFQHWMNKLNQQVGSEITIYHTFRDEVDHYRTHIWKCDGVCQHKPPFFGIVKRSMNRKPQKADSWFDAHEKSCGGTFHKISGPDLQNADAGGATVGKPKVTKTSKVEKASVRKKEKLDLVWKTFGQRRDVGEVQIEQPVGQFSKKEVVESPLLFSDEQHTVNEMETQVCLTSKSSPEVQFIEISEVHGDSRISGSTMDSSITISEDVAELAQCPVCAKLVDIHLINIHLDTCLATTF